MKKNEKCRANILQLYGAAPSTNNKGGALKRVVGLRVCRYTGVCRCLCPQLDLIDAFGNRSQDLISSILWISSDDSLQCVGEFVVEHVVVFKHFPQPVQSAKMQGVQVLDC